MLHRQPLTAPAARRRAVRLRRTAAATVTGVLLVGATLAGPGRSHLPAAAPTTTLDVPADGFVLVSSGSTSHRWKGHPGRWVKHYRVHRGDTATGLAVRFHAWTDELLAINHLSPRSTLYVGERLRIPVVVAAARKARHHKVTHHRAAHHKVTRHKKVTHHTAKKHHAKATHHKPVRHKAVHHKAKHHAPTKHTTTGHGWVHADASRATVRRVVARAAQRRGVSSSLALAIAWQESGWQQHRVSAAGAIGVMQVMPATGRGLSQHLHRRLHLKDLHDNVTAGVLLLHELGSTTGPRYTIAGYYQGLGSIHSRGLYPSTKQYVRSVMTIRDRLRAGWNPAE